MVPACPSPRLEVVSRQRLGYIVGRLGESPSMRQSSRLLTRAFIVALACLAFQTVKLYADDAPLTKEQIKVFLQTAKIINEKPANKGVTQTSRLTLSDGTTTHDASFQSIDEHKSEKKFESGKLEFGFVDSYKYNIAAYRLSELIGLDDMLPVYVERKWQGKSGSLSWWLPVKMDEADRVAKKIAAPDIDKWNNQMYRVRVFDELVYDTDPNLTNVLIGEDWTVWRVDFSRAFRTSKDLRAPKNLVKCDRQLLEKLRNLNANDLAEKTKGYLTKAEVNGVMARRDKIVATFQALVAEKGEKEVLY